MNTPTHEFHDGHDYPGGAEKAMLPEHIGGYQHLAPDIEANATDIMVRGGKPVAFVGPMGGCAVHEVEAESGMNVYRRIPVAKQGDCGEDWKKVAQCHARSVDEGAGVSWDQKPGVIAARALGCNALPADAKARKQIPLYSGLLKYFPRALCAVAELSRIGNEQHNPGKPLHWDRSKSGDEGDALMRHLLEAGTVDSDGVRHATKVCWRSLALLEKELEGLK